MTTTSRVNAPAWLDLLAPDRPDSAARRHLVVAVLLSVVAVALGFASALQLVSPGFLSGVPFSSFGRLRPIYTSTLLFGWLTLAGFGSAYFVVPRLTGVRLWGERLANANLWLALAALVGGLVAVGLGYSEGRPFLEFPIWLDPVIAASLAVPAVVVTATIARRRERNLYVSLWYFLAAVYWLPLLYVIGNLPGLRGVGSALQNWFYAHNLVGLWLVAVAVGAAYYVVPKASDNPLYSHPLAVIGFWSLAFAQVWTGPARLVYGPGPDWAETIALVFSVGLLIPVLVVLANLGGTLTGRWGMVRTSPALRLVVVGGAGYLAVGAIEAIHASRSAAALVDLTLWSEGTFVLAMFGFLTPWLVAFLYYAWPRLMGRDWFSPSLVDWHVRLTVMGVVLGALSLWAGGLVAGFTWAAGAASGAFASTGEGFAQVIGSVRFSALLGLVGTGSIALGQGAFAYNMFRTYTSGVAVPQELLVAVEAEEETADV